MAAHLDNTLNSQDTAALTETCKVKIHKVEKLSKARIEANRRNAQKSTGPKTEEGKARSRQNALKHGMTGAGIVMLPDDRVRLKSRLRAWTEDLEPSDSVEGWLVGRAALASVRLDRCAKVEQAALADRVEDAMFTWDEEQERLALAVARAIDDQPGETVRRLIGHASGCDWLIAEWTRLAGLLQNSGKWGKVERERALHLLGLARTPTQASPERLSRFWAAALAVGGFVDGDAVDAFRGISTAQLSRLDRPAELPKHLPDAATARSALRAFIDEEVARLRVGRAACWEEVDAPLRARAVQKARFDDSQAAERMLRYEKAQAAEVHRCLNLLLRKRKAEARAQAPPESQVEPDPGKARKQDRQAVVQNEPSRDASPETEKVSAVPPAGPTPSPMAQSFPLPRPLRERVGQALAPVARPAVLGVGSSVTAPQPQPRSQNEPRRADRRPQIQGLPRPAVRRPARPAASLQEVARST